jgi:beta-galactosidase
VNAIRVAHSAPSPEFLDEADKLGLLVMDELFDMWSLAKNTV